MCCAGWLVESQDYINVSSKEVVLCVSKQGGFQMLLSF